MGNHRGWASRQSQPPQPHLAHAVASVVGLDAGGRRVQRTALLSQHALQHGGQLWAHPRRCLAALLLLLLLLLIGHAACRATTAATIPRCLLLLLALLRLLCCRCLLLRLALLGRAQGHREPAPGVQVELVQLVEQLAVQALALGEHGQRCRGGWKWQGE